MRFKPQVTYPLIGALLGAGAPVGAFLLRYMVFPTVRMQPVDDLRSNAFFYLYELLATSLVFAIVGFIAGRRADRLQRGKEFYHQLSELDALTGLHNTRAFRDRYRRALDRAVATRAPLAIILVDVDRLKAINDTFGHSAGSEALIRVADALRASKRTADVAARWGGDEFAVLLEGADAAAAMRVADGVMATLRSAPLRLERTTVPLSVTIGICASSLPSAESDLFAAADRALLTGKAAGRNRIEVVSI
ncbi:MAG TPA: GGDEF domain-containing protein [Thermoanaerobaculia bacterium]|nr:GGDEF domain-containing protein [Thermoanaerobaculia bacterium]